MIESSTLILLILKVVTEIHSQNDVVRCSFWYTANMLVMAYFSVCLRNTGQFAFPRITEILVMKNKERFSNGTEKKP